MSNDTTMSPKLFINDIASVNECSMQNVHKIIKEKDIETHRVSNKVYVDNKTARVLIKHEIPNNIISVHTTKGGVGKTTVTMNLGIRFWMFGARVLIIDLDQQGNLSKSFGFPRGDYPVIQDVLEGKTKIQDAIQTVKDDLHVIPSNLNNVHNNQYMQAYNISPDDFLPEQLKKIQNDYDIILFDCPPALGSMVDSASLASNMVISVMDPDDYALDGVEHSQLQIEALNKKKKKDIQFKILLNKYDARTMFSSSTLSELQQNEKFKEYLFDTIIGTSQEFLKSKAQGISIFDGLRHNKASLDIDSLAREILDWPQIEE